MHIKEMNWGIVSLSENRNIVPLTNFDSSLGVLDLELYNIINDAYGVIAFERYYDEHFPNNFKDSYNSSLEKPNPKFLRYLKILNQLHNNLMIIKRVFFDEVSSILHRHDNSDFILYQIDEFMDQELFNIFRNFILYDEFSYDTLLTNPSFSHYLNYLHEHNLKEWRTLTEKLTDLEFYKNTADMNESLFFARKLDLFHLLSAQNIIQNIDSFLLLLYLHMYTPFVTGVDSDIRFNSNIRHYIHLDELAPTQSITDYLENFISIFDTITVETQHFYQFKMLHSASQYHSNSYSFMLSHEIDDLTQILEHSADLKKRYIKHSGKGCFAIMHYNSTRYAAISSYGLYHYDILQKLMDDSTYKLVAPNGNIRYYYTPTEFVIRKTFDDNYSLFDSSVEGLLKRMFSCCERILFTEIETSGNYLPFLIFCSKTSCYMCIRSIENIKTYLPSYDNCTLVFDPTRKAKKYSISEIKKYDDLANILVNLS